MLHTTNAIIKNAHYIRSSLTSPIGGQSFGVLMVAHGPQALVELKQHNFGLDVPRLEDAGIHMVYIDCTDDLVVYANPMPVRADHYARAYPLLRVFIDADVPGLPHYAPQLHQLIIDQLRTIMTLYPDTSRIFDKSAARFIVNLGDTYGTSSELLDKMTARMRTINAKLPGIEARVAVVYDPALRGDILYRNRIPGMHVREWRAAGIEISVVSPTSLVESRGNTFMQVFVVKGYQPTAEVRASLFKSLTTCASALGVTETLLSDFIV